MARVLAPCRRAIAVWSVTTVLSVAAASACSRESVDPSQTSETAVKPQSVAVPLYEQWESADAEGPNGASVDATLAGRSYPASTGMWVGCRGVAATATFRLGRNFTRLTATAGLQDQAPDALAVRVTISGDGQVLDEFTVSKTGTTPVDLSVDGTDVLVVAAILEKGTCAPGRDPYGALGDAVLTTNLD